MRRAGQPPLCEPTPGHIRLLGLVSSLIKLTGCPGFAGRWGTQDVLVARQSAALACCGMLPECARHVSVADGASRSTLPPAAFCSGANSRAVSCPGLAWLVLFGRVCSQWAASLTGLNPARLPAQQPGWQPEWSDPSGMLWLLGLDAQHRMGEPLARVAEWLQLNEGELTAAGYSVRGVSEQLGELQERWQAACVAVEGQTAGQDQAAAAVVVAELAESLRVFGAAVSSTLPVPHFCNNPGCRNVSGDSEVGLVSGRSCMYAGCKVARYCGRSCQRACWKVHKPVCRALAAAAQATAGGAQA
jgi:hypothetical protein